MRHSSRVRYWWSTRVLEHVTWIKLLYRYQSIWQLPLKNYLRKCGLAGFICLPADPTMSAVFYCGKLNVCVDSNSVVLVLVPMVQARFHNKGNLFRSDSTTTWKRDSFNTYITISTTYPTELRWVCHIYTHLQTKIHCH